LDKSDLRRCKIPFSDPPFRRPEEVRRKMDDDSASEVSACLLYSGYRLSILSAPGTVHRINHVRMVERPFATPQRRSSLLLSWRKVKRTKLKSMRLKVEHEKMSKFVGPGELFESDEEEFAEYIEMMEWATQVTPEGFGQFYAVLLAVLDS
jgi:hypothetical protein